jgi:hypothetical protein
LIVVSEKMQNLEIKFHSLLEDIAPEVHTRDEQARIIAEACAIFDKFNSRRYAKKTNHRVAEAQMTECILQAMGSISKWDEDFDTGVINAKGLSASQVVRQAAKSTPATFWGTANVLNPDLLNDMYEDVEDPDLFEFENGDMQDDELFSEKPKHRSDSLSGPSR